MGGHPDPNMLLPLRVGGFRRRWTVGLWQDAGWVTTDPLYQDEPGGGYTELGLDAHNYTHVPLYTGRAQLTRVRVGHPVVAVGSGADQLFVQATRLLTPPDAVGVRRYQFHVAVNNPTFATVSVTLKSSFSEVGMPPQTLTLDPGEHRVLQ